MLLGTLGQERKAQLYTKAGLPASERFAAQVMGVGGMLACQARRLRGCSYQEWESRRSK